MSATDAFDQLPLSQEVLANLKSLEYARMTPVQAASLPMALAGRDLIVEAQTGSGKTAAFGLALLHRIQAASTSTQALVLCPTRELAEQVAGEIRRLARQSGSLKVLTLCGGTALYPQAQSLAHGAQVVVGTPGRVLDHLQRGHLQLQALRVWVLDEADRMLDMGFSDDLTAIAKACPAPAQRQTLLFSATYPDGVQALAQRYLQHPQWVKVKAQVVEGQVEERCYEVSDTQRLHMVGLLLRSLRPDRTLAFCNTKQQCHDLVAVLQAQGISALELHGDLDQRDRDQVLIRFVNRSCSVLVATDVAARGLDIAQLEAVVNVDVASDPDTHVHRIGRTGRAGANGWVATFASLDEMGRIGRIEARLGRESQWYALPKELQEAEPWLPSMVTLQMAGGRKEKIRAGDVLGALTKDLGLPGDAVGKIDINDFSTYVAVRRDCATQALKGLNAAKVKGRSVKVRRL